MTDPLLEAYRHDAHKLTGHSHDTAPEEFAGVPVNRPVPHGADGDAAALSRPSGEQAQTVPAHGTRFRLSLLSGNTQEETGPADQGVESALSGLLTVGDAVKTHRAWLSTEVASAFSESVYHPYTSLKYHTLLVGALLANYHAGATFGDLALVVDPVEKVVAHRTVYAGESFALRLTTDSRADDEGRPAARLGPHP